MSAAEFFDHYGIVAQVIAGLVLAMILALVGAAKGWFTKARRHPWGKGVPKSLIFVTRDEVYTPRWTAGKGFDDWYLLPNVQVFVSFSSRWWVTATSDKPVRLVQVVFESSRTGVPKILSGAMVLLRGWYEGRVLDVEITGTVNLHVEFYGLPDELFDEDMRIVGRVIFVDQFGNRYHTPVLLYERQ